MKQGRNKKHILLYFLLAALCVAGMELLFCSHFAPVTFARITGPVVQAVEDFSTEVRTRWNRLVTGIEVRSLLRECAQASAGPFPIELSPPQVAQEPSAMEGRKDFVPVDPVITQFTKVGGREILTGGVIPCVYYNQKEAPWSSMSFGGDPIGPYGCGPVAMSMVVSSMTDKDIDPGQMAAWAAENGYWAPQSGSYHNLIPDSATAYGLGSTRLSSCSPDQMMRALAQGNMLVALMGPGHFTDSGHFIVLHGVTLSGEILIADPNSRENSLTVWDPQLLLDEMYVNETYGLGLWQISSPPPQL